MRSHLALTSLALAAGLTASGCGAWTLPIPLTDPCDSTTVCAVGFQCRNGTCQRSSDPGDASINTGADGSFSGADASSGADDSDAAVPGYCGDGRRDKAEQCDDGNSTPGDGCDGTCRIEPGYSCPTPGLPCIYTVTAICGNGAIEGAEACDDGNTHDGDGCSAGCQVEPGWACELPGRPCKPVIVVKCGDGMVHSGEQCDDANTTPGDGCSATCQLESGWTCPTPGHPCQKLEYCGDKIVQASRGEACDDGNALPGDGCDGTCHLEPGYACPPAGTPCVKIWVCGNGRVNPGEACDDRNTTSGDGCSADCTQVEAGYICPKAADGTGGPCVKQPSNVCGDGRIAGLEQCDDGNTTAGDGCSATCMAEPGYTCPTPGKSCVPIGRCGDGKLDLALGEQCDDGGTASGDGCTSLCKLEPNFVCPAPGKPCVSTVVCGDGKVLGNETCDDGNKTSGDGCSSSCRVETGWQCPTPGAKCQAKACGDGIVAGNEQCDDGNAVDGDGCSSTCKLQATVTVTDPSPTRQPSTIVHNFKCPIPGKPCIETVCGDGLKEGTEQCDDGNLAPFDGCSPNCTLEPSCPNGACTARCGDEFLFDSAGEACDDGNVADGDGCSSTCQIESGFTCQKVVQAPLPYVDIPVVFRDFELWGNPIHWGDPTHPDFERYLCMGVSTGLVKPNLSHRVPVYENGAGAPGCGPQLTSAKDLTDWYRDIDVDGVRRSKRIDGLQIRLTKQWDGSYLFDSAADEPYQSLDGFFPIDGRGWGNQGTDSACRSHNFGFTTELRYWFTYDASQSPRLDFSGDDDVWFFVNNRLALDLGGIHPMRSGSFVLDPTTAASLGLVDQHVYEIAAFHAERHTVASNFKLTLRNFVKASSLCTPICGDGKALGNEVCDDGKNDGRYGGCMPGCHARAPYCGDGTVNGPEQCDDGTNLATYGGKNKVCGPGCTWAPYCGDGIVSNGEQCDEGSLNGKGSSLCTADCTLAPRCGDGIVNSPQEQCDDGPANGTNGDRCDAHCLLKCGNGVLDPGEVCDNGSQNGRGGYGKCSSDCMFYPHCGDGIVNGTEKCDDALNDGTYGTCKPDCTLASYCGDGIVDPAHESCDLGASNSATAYGPGKCTNHCTVAPKCGDKAVDGAFGEICDDGVNSGLPGSCTSDCKAFVPLNTCGNGAIDPGEQCDAGAANGTAGSACDAHCRTKCGNGIKNPGEQCDNGVNDGRYGTCNPDCTFAGYCGDGSKNGPEQCDHGTGNIEASTAYGAGVCTTACTPAPYCGDGRVDARFGEECDPPGPGCLANCKREKPN